MKTVKIITLFSSFVALQFPAYAAKEPQLTGLALQQIQSKDFETTADMLFPSVVTVLQDSGYRITEADKISGFISGIASAEQKLTYNIWWGLGQKKEVPMVSVFVEQRGPNISRARINFVLSKAKSRNSYTDEKPITDPSVYRDAFERIEKELFIRMSMNQASELKNVEVSAPKTGSVLGNNGPGLANVEAAPASDVPMKVE